VSKQRHRPKKWRTAKLTEQQASEILDRHRRFGVKAATLAPEYGVSQECIFDLLSGRTWKHLR